MSMVEDRLRELGYELPPPNTPAANYVGAVQTGNLVFVAGHGPGRGGQHLVPGKLGKELTVEDGQEAARHCVLAALASLKAEIGNLDRVTRIVKLLGMVNCTPDFVQQPQVINGGADLLTALFGARGRHARSAVGMQSLPNGIPVEIEMVVEIA